MRRLPSALRQATSPVFIQPSVQSLREFVSSLRYPAVSHGARTCRAPGVLSSFGTSRPCSSTSRSRTRGRALPVRVRRAAWVSRSSCSSASESRERLRMGQVSDMP